ncbi:hypothetical protein ACFL2T_06435 [Elusimicrobiota bacterium]
MRPLAVLLALVLNAGSLHALGKTEVDLEFDAYYSALGLTVPFTEEDSQVEPDTGEFRIYWDLVRRGLIPRFLVLEASVNPMPLAGVIVRKNAEHFYEEAQATPNINLVEAITTGFEEPYAVAIFLGNVVDFSGGKKTLGRARKGYTGYLASAGNYHIMNNLLIPDNWLEVEGKIKGDQKTEKRKMSWSFRGGRKMHNNREILDTYYVGMRRNRVDFEKTKYSFILSTAIEYRVDFSHESMEPVSHFLLLEKNFPIPKKKWTFSLGIGYIWRSMKKYSGTLADRRRSVNSQVMLRPNLKF